MARQSRDFSELLRDCHVQASYTDVTGRRHRASVDTLISVLRALGVKIDRTDDAAELLRHRRRERLRRGIEPVYMAWNGSPPPVWVSIPVAGRTGSIQFELRHGNDRVQRGFRIDELATKKDASEESEGFVSVSLPLPKELPIGYYDLEIDAGASRFQSLVISSPRRAFTWPGNAPACDNARGNELSAGGRWGCFLPLYALRTDNDWGIGDFTSLCELVRWAGGLGASDVGTLPLLAAFLDEPLEISPYRPASRLFWNELYIDVEAIPEVQAWADCRQMIESGDFRHNLNELRDSELVDYVDVMRLKRRVFELLASRYVASVAGRKAIRGFAAENPLVDDYARFRALQERQRKPWTEWPTSMREGRLENGDYDHRIADYHRYVQRVAAMQLAQVRQESGAARSGVYLDLPIGVHPAGFDTWRYPQHYVIGASVGAPPDIVFPKGQDWGLPPLHPDRSRECGHELFRKVMENNCRYAGRLRVDHILGFHRLYCIPAGNRADQGAFIRLPAEELYAIAIVESHRWRCELVGENLGTVPPEVNRRLRSHAIAGMWVAPYELEPGRRQALSIPTEHDVAMLNTHDMPPFAAWWKGLDIDEREELGLIDANARARERGERRAARRQLKKWLRAVGAVDADDANEDEIPPLIELLCTIAASPARLVLINLEDLWHETRSQNVPGTSDEHPNWRRKARYTVEGFSKMPEVREALEETNVRRSAQVASMTARP